MALQPARESRFGPNVFELPPELAGWVPIGPETSRARAFVSHVVDVYLGEIVRLPTPSASLLNTSPVSLLLLDHFHLTWPHAFLL